MEVFQSANEVDLGEMLDDAPGKAGWLRRISLTPRKIAKGLRGSTKKHTGAGAGKAPGAVPVITKVMSRAEVLKYGKFDSPKMKKTGWVDAIAERTEGQELLGTIPQQSRDLFEARHELVRARTPGLGPRGAHCARRSHPRGSTPRSSSTSRRCLCGRRR